MFKIQDLTSEFPRSSPEQDKSIDYEQLSHFIETLRDSNIPIIIQVTAWHSIPDNFRSNIQSLYQVLWHNRS